MYGYIFVIQSKAERERQGSHVFFYMGKLKEWPERREWYIKEW
jgi:hypothetical protein